MKHLKKLLTRPLVNISTSLVIIALIVAILGFADATYLTVEHYQGVIPPCSITGGCEKVLTSEFSTLLGMPTSLLGAVYYLLLCVGLFLYLDMRKSVILKGALMLPWFGLGFSAWFTYLQVFSIHSYCTYCLTSAGISVILFVISFLSFKRSHSFHENI